MEEKTFFKGSWKAIGKIGEGTFGIVYKAERKQYGVTSYSAIKQILIPHSDKEYLLQKSEGMTQRDIEKSFDNQVEKWVSEIEFLNQFKGNANIVSIEDFEVLERVDKPGRIINIKMELLQSIEGNELNKILTDKKVLKMALDILNALEECEEKNVVHRDIKPDNVFVNDRGIFKLGDFGEAKNIEKTLSNMSKRGTENYMAPEIYKGERGSKSVDTYSLGIMLYKYFNNNRIPFLPDYPASITCEDRENALYKRMSGEEMKAPVKASSNITKIILKACSYNPKDRYKSATELKTDIEKEYKSIEKPTKLFDFQQEEIKEEEKNSLQPQTSKEIESIKENLSDNLKEKSNYDETVSIFRDFVPKGEDNKKADNSSNTPEGHNDSDGKESAKNIDHDNVNDKQKNVNDKKEEPIKQAENNKQDDNAKKIVNETINNKNEKTNNHVEDKKSSNDKADEKINNANANSQEDPFKEFGDINYEELVNQMFNNKKERPNQQSDYKKAQDDKKQAKQKEREAKQELERKKKAELRAKNKFIFSIYSFLEFICGLLFWIIIGLGIFDIFNGLFAGLILTFGLFIVLSIIWHLIKTFLEWLINVFDQTKKK